MKLLLSEDQASCLLSDEDYRPTLGETDLAHVNTADVSLGQYLELVSGSGLLGFVVSLVIAVS